MDGSAVRSIHQVKKGERVSARVSDGQLRLVVEHQRPGA